MNWIKLTHWTLLVAVIVYIVTGLGITESRTVEPLTLGLLTKALAFQIHSALVIPFVLLVVAHVALVLNKRRK